MAAAAFFDLDRTLLRRSSARALAGSFRDRGLIGRGQLARAAQRGRPVLELSELLHPVPDRRRIPVAAVGIPLVLGAGAAAWAARRRGVGSTEPRESAGAGSAGAGAGNRAA